MWGLAVCFCLTRLGVTIQSCRGIIWLASWIVPKPLRREWSAMWRNKVWHWANFLAESGRLDGQNQRILIRNCWGAFAEAFWIRYDRETFLIRKQRLLRSPWTVSCSRAATADGIALAGGFVPPRSALFSQPTYQADRVAIVSFKASMFESAAKRFCISAQFGKARRRRRSLRFTPRDRVGCPTTGAKFRLLNHAWGPSSSN